MHNINRLISNIRTQVPEAEDLFYRFIITFSRFECSLKNTSRFLNKERVEADWKTFSDHIQFMFNQNLSPEIKEAVNYILSDPPKIQTINNGMLEWRPDAVLIREEEYSLAEKLSIYIFRIRNNLVHGGKFNGTYNPDSRNFKLISSALVILNNWIDLDQEVRSNFLSDIV